MSKQSIIQILINRDQLTAEEATERVEECEQAIREVIANCEESPWEALETIRDITRDELGLEPDYTEYLIMEV